MTRSGRGVVILVVVSFAFGYGQNGLDFTYSWPIGNSVGGHYGVYSLSYFTPNPKLPGFLEFGFTGMPEGKWQAERVSEDPSTVSFMGLYAGHIFLLFGGHLRPGFHVGTIYEVITDFPLVDGRIPEGEKVKTDGRFVPYFGLKAQFLIFSILLSNKSLGGGFNFSL